MKITLVALMGLPSSGKSTLCSAILTHGYRFKEPTKILHFVYDDFVPISVQREYSTFSQDKEGVEGVAELGGSNATLAKILRCRFLRTIEYLVENLQGFDGSDFSEGVISELNNILESEFSNKHNLAISESFGSRFLRVVEAVKFQEYKNIVVLIDDNNYYHSMRNEVYQIAKKFKTGFCILYPITSLQECLARNSAREEAARVPDAAIHTMHAKLEEPDPMKNVCDAFCLQIQNVLDVRIHSEIQATLESSLLNPIDIEVEDRREEIERERRICAENEIHQADQILRKWIHTSTITSRLVPGPSSTGQSKESLRAFSEGLLQKKNEIISGLRSGSITVKSQVSDFLGFQKEILEFANSSQS